MTHWCRLCFTVFAPIYHFTQHLWVIGLCITGVIAAITGDKFSMNGCALLAVSGPRCANAASSSSLVLEQHCEQRSLVSPPTTSLPIADATNRCDSEIMSATVPPADIETPRTHSIILRSGSCPVASACGRRAKPSVSDSDSWQAVLPPAQVTVNYGEGSPPRTGIRQ